MIALLLLVMLELIQLDLLEVFLLLQFELSSLLGLSKLLVKLGGHSLLELDLSLLRLFLLERPTGCLLKRLRRTLNSNNSFVG